MSDLFKTAIYVFITALSAFSFGAKAAPSLTPDYWSVIGLEQCTNGLWARACPPAIAPGGGDLPGDGPLTDPWTDEFAGTYTTQVAGFAPIPEPGPTDREVYVSTSGGSDSNDCLSAASACATLTKAGTLIRDGFSDRLLLKRGDVFQLTTYWSDYYRTGRNNEERFIVASYGGSGPRPIVEYNGHWIQGSFNGKSNMTFSGLEFYFSGHDPDSPLFDAGVNTSSSIGHRGTYHNITFDDNVFRYGELVMQGIDETQFPQNVVLNRNIFDQAYTHSSRTLTGSKPSNIYVDNIIDLKIIENTFYFGGWNPRIRDQIIQTADGPVEITGAGPNMYNHNAYITNRNGGHLELLRNVALEGSATGLMNRSGGYTTANFTAGATTGLHTIGYGEAPEHQPPEVITRVFDNVIVEGTPMHKHEPDYWCPTSSCTPALYGMTISHKIQDTTAVDIIYGRNIIANPDLGDNPGSLTKKSFGYGEFNDGKTVPYTFYTEGADANIQYKWVDENEGVGPSYPDPNRDLTSYAESLGLGSSRVAFGEVLVNRGYRQWSTAYSAEGAVNYVRAGFGLDPITYTPFY